jgi:flagellar motility protein MotE (MotC chaperone)
VIVLPKIINIDGVAQQQDQLTENSNVTEENKWEDKIYEIDEQDYVHGGVHGFDNIPHEQLANRTAFLKTTCENIITDIANLKDAIAKQNDKNDKDFSDIRNNIRKLQSDLADLTKVVNDEEDKNKNLLDKQEQMLIS